MKRGDLVIVALAGDYGKPRPALIIQSDAFADHPSVTVLLLTSDVINSPRTRISVPPNSATGLSKLSQVMIDKAMTLPRAKIGKTIGRVDQDILNQVTNALAKFLEFA
jgi:mRNA interferase MazF